MNSYKTILFVLILFLSIGLKAQERPNILWINGDDLGRELGCYGNPDVKTPNMDKLAEQGVKYLHAYSNAAVCSASRSSQITGMYPSAINCLNHRTIEMQKLPEGVVPVMEIFRNQGYFCTNGWADNMTEKGKEDYNFLGKNFFDGTDWNQRAEGQPFFAQVQIHEPHRDFVHDKERPIDYTKVTLPGCYPDYPLLKADWALYLEMVQQADKQVGYIMQRLEDEGLAENTIVFLFGDHGRPHLRDKQWLYEGGLSIPLIVRYPQKMKAGIVKTDLVSLVDVTASSLAACGIEIPEHMHGIDFLHGEKRNYVFGFRQRCGDAIDDIRSITDGRYKLIWNRMPELPYMQLTSYKKLQYPAFSLYKVLQSKGELEAPYNQFMAETRPEFELYDLKTDPNELNNLDGLKKYQKVKSELLSVLKSKLAEVEMDMVRESSEVILAAKRGSEKFLAEGFKKKGLPVDATDEEIVKQWEKELLK